MAIINWDESYSVKIKSIDKQHQQLFELINQFIEKTLVKSIDNDDLLEVLQSLTNYADIHFKQEEEMMRMANYNRLETHILEHSFFLQTVNDFKFKLNHNHAVAAFEISNFIREWIIDHIKNTDKKYSDSLHQAGIV